MGAHAFLQAKGARQAHKTLVRCCSLIGATRCCDTPYSPPTVDVYLVAVVQHAHEGALARAREPALHRTRACGGLQPSRGNDVGRQHDRMKHGTRGHVRAHAHVSARSGRSADRSPTPVVLSQTATALSKAQSIKMNAAGSC